MLNFKHKSVFKRLSVAYRAFSIAETITALLIISISFGAGMSIYTQVMDADKLYAKTNLSFVLDQILVKAKAERNFVDETLEIDNVKIVKKTESFEGNVKVYKMTISAFDPSTDVLILEINELVSTQ